MKKILAILGLTAAMSAQAAPVCQHYEFAELNSMNRNELLDLQAGFIKKMMGIMSIRPTTPERQFEFENCDAEAKRVNRIRSQRIAEEEAKKGVK